MNSLTPLALPRFHVNALAATPKGQNAPLGQDAGAPAFEAEAQLEHADGETDTIDDAAEMTLPPLPSEIDTGAILQSLESLVSGLEHQAAEHANQAVTEFIQAAFPRLAEAFLAEEVMRELAETAPPQIEKLSIKVPTQLGVSFQTAVQASPRLNEICDLQMQDGSTDMLVDADWQTGGLQFDLQRFFESSLARMAGPERV